LIKEDKKNNILRTKKEIQRLIECVLNTFLVYQKQPEDGRPISHILPWSSKSRVKKDAMDNGAASFRFVLMASFSE